MSEPVPAAPARLAAASPGPRAMAAPCRRRRPALPAADPGRAAPAHMPRRLVLPLALVLLASQAAAPVAARAQSPEAQRELLRQQALRRELVERELLRRQAVQGALLDRQRREELFLQQEQLGARIGQPQPPFSTVPTAPPGQPPFSVTPAPFRPGG